MSRHTPPTSVAQAARPAALRLGERVRQLRIAAGLTQSELAGDRFSKEYVSQIERGKTRPTGETIAWLASRLDVDAGYLANGVSTDDRGRVEATLTRAEALAGAHRYEEAVAEFEQIRPDVAATGAAELEARLLSGEAWARMHSGELREALDLLTRARTVTQSEQFSELDQAEILYRLGVCRYRLSSISTAIGLFNEAYASPKDRGCPATSFARASWPTARAATAASATSKLRAKTSSAHSSWRSRSTTARRWPTSMSRPRSSPSAWVTGCWPVTMRSARRVSTRS